jgi:iron complex transport system ATP-binding protein
MLEIENLYSGYGGPDIIRGVNLQANRGEILCIVGPNGCGKSTLLKTIAHTLKYRGYIRLDGQDISSFSGKALARNIALMGQLSQIYFPYTVYDTVSLGRYAHSRGFLKTLTGEDKALISDIIQTLGLYGVRDRLITELSGGQLQRVFLARTLVQNPDIILLDEPTNHLDLKNQIELLHYLSRWVKDRNRTVIGVLHDLNLVHSFSDRAALMTEGKIRDLGEPAAILEGETLEAVYGFDIKKFMLESLEKWK